MKTASKPLPLLVEIGCEEIPARFLADAEKQFGERLQAALTEARLLAAAADHEPPLHTYSTPRRLVTHVPQVLGKQADQVEEVLGPPARVAFDADGKPTRAAESFAQKNSVSVKDLVRITNPKGEYLAVRKTTQGRPASEILSSVLPQVIAGLNFPKSMYWVAKAGPRWVRPIRWIVALLGEGSQAKVIPFEVAGVKSGKATYGHRAYAQGPIPVSGFKEYAKKLRRAYVEFDPACRKTAVQNESQVLLEPHLRLVEDKNLEEWLTHSTEWPSAIRGGFHERFLYLPREILVTVMRDHQKYFAVENQKGNLQPLFVATLNRDDDPRGLIRQGHERVLTARFSDAEFFWASDQRTPLAQRREILQRVTYQAELGSYAEKVRRMEVIARHLGETEGVFTPEARQFALRAVELCKCDLTTQMVQEFTELQGVVGGLYAAVQGEPKEVHEAIYDHYLPQGAEDRCPRSAVGAVVSLADKLDSVVGGFAVGHEPSSSSDPFALRRQANGIVKVLLELQLPIALKPAVETALNSLDVSWHSPKLEVFQRVVDFFAERLKYYFETVRGFRYDTVRAVLAAGWEPPLDALARAEALESLRGSEDLEAVCAAAKRIKNILTKSAGAEVVDGDTVDASLLTEGPERVLFEAWRTVAERSGASRAQRDYRSAFAEIASLRPAVDKFFDKVLVMAEEPQLRRNRLKLLRLLDELFSALAQFAEIASAGAANVDASTSRAVKGGK